MSPTKPAAATAPATAQKTYTLTDDQTGKSWKLPVLEGTTGPSVIDVRKLYDETGMFTFDPSYTSTASCKSRITYIDGDNGILMHRGYRIEELAKQSDLPGSRLRAAERRPSEPEANMRIHSQHHLSHDGA
jgi:hypothetical protein